MTKWKSLFINSLDPGLGPSIEELVFGPPASDQDLADLEQVIKAKIPSEVCELLREFNGIDEIEYDEQSPYFFGTKTMPTAADFYRDWDWPTDLFLDWSRNLLYIYQENGYAAMYAVVIKPFGKFKYGEIVSFDHDRIPNANEPHQLFRHCRGGLDSLVSRNPKES